MINVLEDELKLIHEYYLLFKKDKEKYGHLILNFFKNEKSNINVESLLYIHSKNKIKFIEICLMFRYLSARTPEERYIVVLENLKFFDIRNKDKDLSEYIYDKKEYYGILAVGKRIWDREDQIPGYNLFPHIRYIKLSEVEYNVYINSIKKLKNSQLCKIFNKGKLIVGSSSLPSIKPKIKNTRKLGSGQGFISEEVEEQTYEDKIKESLDYVIENNIEIWLFPESCVDEKIVKILKNSLKEKKEEIKDLKLIIPGSTYITDSSKGSDKYFNRAPIWIIKNNELVELGYYDKNIPVSSSSLKNEKFIVEDLSTEIGLRIIKFETGYIGIAICRDVLDPFDNNNPLNRYCDFVDIMLVISCNPGHTNGFTSTAETMARWHNCATVYNNNMESSKKEDKIIELAFAIFPKLKTEIGTERVSGITGKIYYRTHPGFNLKNENTGKEIIGNTITSIYSKGVEADKIPENGNVKYELIK